jgi:hypothetical protein
VFLDCTSLTLSEQEQGLNANAVADHPTVDVETIREYHVLKSRDDCAYLRCTEPYRSSERRFLLQLEYADVWVNDMRPMIDFEFQERFGNDNKVLTVKEVADTNVNTLCMKCEMRRIQVVFFPCHCCVLCAECSSKTIVCPGCKQNVGGYTRLILS